MIRFHVITNAQAAISYFDKSDGGYFAGQDDLRTEWGGNGSKLLWLSGKPDFEQFKRLIQGNDPYSGEQLTAKLIDDRIPGWDVTASIPKGVTLALEAGDSRIHQILWEANREAMADLEQYATTRVRKGGMQDDRKTGNLIWYSVEHAETRPAKEDRMPDADRHIHNVLMNLTFDGAEREWKALKFRRIMDYRKYFDRRFDLRLSSKLADLGYGIETKYKADEQGGRKYFTWDIVGIPQSLILKNSRRSQEVEALAGELGVGTVQGKDKLGATSRLFKRKDLTLADLRDYWRGKITTEEQRAIDNLLAEVMAEDHAKTVSNVSEASSYALAHQFERHSVTDWHYVAVTAMEHCMGAGNPNDIIPELKRQGLLIKDTEATTKKVLRQERRIVAFARMGRGTMKPLKPLFLTSELDGLSDEQANVVKHFWQSSDQILLIRGGAGTGKTTLMKRAIGGIDRPVAVLAPSTDASRIVLRQEGFREANTVAAFLRDKDWQERTRNGVIWCDEAGLLLIDDLDALCKLAESLNARIVLSGDPRQHKAVGRHGNMLRVLETQAKLPVAELKTIRRQQGDYGRAVEGIRDGDYAAGLKVLNDLGWIVQGGHEHLAREYEAALRKKQSIVVIDPTHKDGDVLTQRLRKLRKGYGLITGEERTFKKLVQLGWSEAEKRDRNRYDGTEVICLFERFGKYKVGAKVQASELLGKLGKLKSFGVYRKDEIKLAVGDTVRLTASAKGEGLDIDRGAVETVKGFKGDDIVLTDGRIIKKDFGHLDYGLVQTSYASQSKTVDVVLTSMNEISAPAISAEQAYVSTSRGRKKGMIFTNLSWDELLKNVEKKDERISAIEWLKQKKMVAEKRKRAYVQWERKREAMMRDRGRVRA